MFQGDACDFRMAALELIPVLYLDVISAHRYDNNNLIHLVIHITQIQVVYKQISDQIRPIKGYMTFRPIHFQHMQFQSLPFRPFTISTFCIFNRPQF